MKDFRDYSLLCHNTFGIDAQCQRFVEFASVKELQTLVRSLTTADQPLLVIGGGSNLLFTADDANNYYEDEVQKIISDFDNFDDVGNFLKERREVYDAICALGEDEAVVTYRGSLYEEIKLHSMSYYFDTHHYAIGVIDWDNED